MPRDLTRDRQRDLAIVQNHWTPPTSWTTASRQPRRRVSRLRRLMTWASRLVRR